MKYADLQALARALVKRAFPASRIRKVHIDVSGKFTFSDLHWSEGCKNHYVAVSIGGNGVDTIGPYSNTPWDEPLEGETVELPEGVAMVIQRFHGTTQSIIVHFCKGQTV